ncbi:MAG TPA: DUF6194 family protein [Anaerolineae bacterium]|nr:DUF6194 family protein [Anaerolineae bacterium]
MTDVSDHDASAPTEEQIAQYILDTFPGVETTTNLGYTFFFYGAERMLPFATIASSGNEYERISNLDRPGVFRLNIGVSKATFQSLFGADKVDVSNYDYTALDRIMPHPDYAAQSWICVLNPSQATFERVRTWLAEAYELARGRAARRAKTE